MKTIAFALALIAATAAFSVATPGTAEARGECYPFYCPY
jgi:hypothetical protein